MNPNMPVADPSVCVISGTESVSYHQHMQPPPPYTANDFPITSQPVVERIVIQAPLKIIKTPIVYICPKCRESVVTKVRTVNSKKTHLTAGFIFGFTCWCCLCCFAAIPYFLPFLKRNEHSCPQCKMLLNP